MTSVGETKKTSIAAEHKQVAQPEDYFSFKDLEIAVLKDRLFSAHSEAMRDSVLNDLMRHAWDHGASLCDLQSGQDVKDATAHHYSVEEMFSLLTRVAPDATFYTAREGASLVCRSPKNRARLLAKLCKHNIRFTMRVLGQTHGRGRRLMRWVGTNTKNLRCWDTARIAHWIQQQRLEGEQVEKLCQENKYYNFEDVRAAWSGSLTTREIRELIDDKWGHDLKDDKYTPFDNCFLRRTIVEIATA